MTELADTVASEFAGHFENIAARLHTGQIITSAEDSRPRRHEKPRLGSA